MVMGDKVIMSDKKPIGNQKEAPRNFKRRASFVVNNQHTITSRFGNTIRSKREQLHLTQTELAKLANLNRSYLSELERGIANISLERAARLAKALNCTLRELIE